MALTIYRITTDVDSYWWLHPAQGELWMALKRFNVESMREHWKAMPFYVDDPVRTQKGDFYEVSSGALAYSKRVYESVVGEIMERAGEVLPATLEQTGEEFFIFNCTACYNCLDRDKTEMRTTPDGTVAINVVRYAFHADRIGDSTLFKIPETRRVGLYALTGRGDASDEFFTQYHALSFTGLKFDEVWRG